jgi:hypothetical protein
LRPSSSIAGILKDLFANLGCNESPPAKQFGMTMRRFIAIQECVFRALFCLGFAMREAKNSFRSDFFAHE